MRRRPEDLGEEREGPSPRAWGIVLGAWFVIFVFLGLVVVPLLFSTCGASYHPDRPFGLVGALPHTAGPTAPVY